MKNTTLFFFCFLFCSVIYSQNNLVEENWVDADGNQLDQYTYKYEYDKRQNWTKKVACRNGLPVTIMEREFEARIENRKKAQIRQANFPAKMYLSDLEKEHLPAMAAAAG